MRELISKRMDENGSTNPTHNQNNQLLDDDLQRLITGEFLSQGASRKVRYKESKRSRVATTRTCTDSEGAGVRRRDLLRVGPYLPSSTRQN